MPFGDQVTAVFSELLIERAQFNIRVESRCDREVVQESNKCITRFRHFVCSNMLVLVRNDVALSVLMIAVCAASN